MGMEGKGGGGDGDGWEWRVRGEGVMGGNEGDKVGITFFISLFCIFHLYM